MVYVGNNRNIAVFHGGKVREYSNKKSRSRDFENERIIVKNLKSKEIYNKIKNKIDNNP